MNRPRTRSRHHALAPQTFIYFLIRTIHTHSKMLRILFAVMALFAMCSTELASAKGGGLCKTGFGSACFLLYFDMWGALDG